MKLKELYKFIIDYGQKKDPRGIKGVSQEISRLKQGFSELPKRAQEEFDKDRLTNPYPDTQILNGDPELVIRSILAGIDIEVGEVILADRLREKGKRLDLLMSHHPEGKAHAGFFNVMYMQADILNKYGVPINVAEGILEDRIKEVERKVMPANHNRAVDAARLLGIPFMCVHTPSDNGVATYLQDLLDKKELGVVGDILKILEEIPEYKHEIENNISPKIVVGKERNRAGKIFVDMTGGTEGSEKMFQVLAQAGVGTIVGMHLSDKHIQEANKHNINIVIAGHMASDNIGMNLLLDELQKSPKGGSASGRKEKLDITCCSGFYRVER